MRRLGGGGTRNGAGLLFTPEAAAIGPQVAGCPGRRGTVSVPRMASEPPPSAPPPQRASPVASSPNRPSSRTRSPWLIIAAVLVALAAVVAIPAKTHIERWRAATLARQANELARQQLVADAIERFQIALSLDPNQIDALRNLSKFYSAYEKPAALPTWRKLLAHPAHTEQDLLDYLDFALRSQRYDLAEAELARQLEKTNAPAAIQLAAADLRSLQGDPENALGFARKALSTNPDNPSFQFRVARSLLAVPNPARQLEGFRQLAGRKPLSPAERLELYQTLLSVPSLPIAETKAFLDALPPISPSEASDLVGQTEVRLRLNPDPVTRERLFSEVIQGLRKGSSEDKVTLCRWLLRLRAPTRILDTFSLADSAATPVLLPFYLEALGLAQRWDELIRATDNPLNIDPWLFHTFRAAAGFQLKKESLGREHWRRALESTQNDPVRILAVGDIAHHLGVHDRAIEAFNIVDKSDLYRTAAYRRLAKVYEEIRDTERLRRLMFEWSVHSPYDPFPSSAYAYLCALVRRDLDDARSRIMQLTQAFPSRTGYRSTLAFIELRRDQPQAALQLLQRTSSEPSTSSQTTLVRALVLDANGQTSAAKDLLRSLRLEALLPEELDLVQKLKAR